MVVVPHYILHLLQEYICKFDLKENIDDCFKIFYGRCCLYFVFKLLYANCFLPYMRFVMRRNRFPHKALFS